MEENFCCWSSDPTIYCCTVHDVKIFSNGFNSGSYAWDCEHTVYLCSTSFFTTNIMLLLSWLTSANDGVVIVCRLKFGFWWIFGPFRAQNEIPPASTQFRGRKRQVSFPSFTDHFHFLFFHVFMKTENWWTMNMKTPTIRHMMLSM